MSLERSYDGLSLVSGSPGFGWWSLCLVGFLVVSVGVAAERELSEPERLVAETTERMLELIEEARSYVDEDPERFYAEVEALLTPVIDFPRFARGVMAAYYRRATPEQRSRFEAEFKQALLRTYARTLTEFKDGEVVIVPSDRPPRQPDRASVKQEIRTQGDVYPVIYSMARDDDGRWRVRNIIINGINLGLTYRNQFASAVNDPAYGGDMDRIIDGWVSTLGTVDTVKGEGGSSPASHPVGDEAVSGD